MSIGIKTQVNNLVLRAHMDAKIAGWWDGVDIHDVHVVPAKLCLIHSEISEAMEGHRKSAMDDHLKERSMLEVELADAVIRIADLAGCLKLDLGGAIIDKMEYNQNRADHKRANREKANGKKF
jgi:NTP pyrophosphatase (non-canonical NTP hydrolase)